MINQEIRNKNEIYQGIVTDCWVSRIADSDFNKGFYFKLSDSSDAVHFISAESSLYQSFSFVVMDAMEKGYKIQTKRYAHDMGYRPMITIISH